MALGTAGTATAGATVGLFGAGGAFSIMQTVSTLGTIGSMFSALGEGQAAKAEASTEAAFEKFRARQDRLRGTQEATKIKEDLAAAISSSVAIGGAQGVDISSGSPANAVKKAQRDAENAWDIAKYNAEQDAQSREFNAYTAVMRGKNAYRSSRVRAAGIFSDYMMKQSDRGMRF